MNLNLRQAHKVVQKINGRLGEIEITPVTTWSIWEITNAEQTVIDFQKQFVESVSRNQALVAARQEIRDAIMVANRISVDALVSKRKALLDKAGLIKRVMDTRAPVNASFSALTLALRVSVARKAAEGGGDRYSSNDNVMYSLINDDAKKEYEVELNQIRLDIEKIEDLLSVANISGEITLSMITVDTLTKEQVIQ